MPKAEVVVADWWSRPDRTQLVACTICDAKPGEWCTGTSTRHVGRVWELPLTAGWGIARYGEDEFPAGEPWPKCTPVVEDRHRPTEPGDLRHLEYRGACLGCGWAGDTVATEQAALEAAHDHVYPRWRELPVQGRCPQQSGASDSPRNVKHRQVWMGRLNAERDRLGFGPEYHLGTGAPLLTHRARMASRSHWVHEFGGYDICVKIVADDQASKRHAPETKKQRRKSSGVQPALF